MFCRRKGGLFLENLIPVFEQEDALYLVHAKALPPVFFKVVYAKRLYATGQAKTLSQAAQMAGISRSALYRYKDLVSLYQPAQGHRLVSLSIVLEDQPGVLGRLLEAFGRHGLNVLTINQTIPADGVAGVTVALQTVDPAQSPGEIMRQIGNLDGVIRIRQITGS